jgi:hypothetical protein
MGDTIGKAKRERNRTSMKSPDPLPAIRDSLERDLEAVDRQIARYEEYAWSIHRLKDALEVGRDKLAQALNRIRETDQLYGGSEQLCTPPLWEALPDEE